jgi:hypothetical protein
VLALSAGCGGREEARPVCDGVTGMVVTRVAGHAGGGQELTARLRFDDGIPIAEADLVQCLSIHGAPGAAIARRPMAASYSLLLVDPGNTRRDADAARDLVEDFLEKRPPSEAVAIFRWGEVATQIAPFHTDRRLLLERLAVGLAAAPAVQPAAEALAAAAAALSATGGPARDAFRAIVLVAPRASGLVGLAGAMERASPHLVTWIGASTEEGRASALPAGLRFPIGPQRVPAQVMAGLSARLEAYRQHAHYAIGLCGQGRAVELRFRQGDPMPLLLPDSLPEDRPGTCRAEALAGGQREYPQRLELVFSAEQRATAEAAFADQQGRPPFELSVRLSPEVPAMRATARFRGDASYACQRRSYAVELAGTEPRFLFRGAAARRFELVAMCLDRMYLRTFTGLQMLAAEGLFPVPFDLVEVAIDGVSQGPYLILEDVADSVRVRSSRLSSVVRRLKQGGLSPVDVRWSATSSEDARARYDRILAAGMGQSGRRLEAALDELFDLQGYLTWVGLMNLLGSGGHSDQIFFYAAETTAPDGTRSDYHLMMGGDEDDLFARCRAGARAIVDPLGLVSCAEAELDRRIFSDPLLYARYAGVLGSLLERQPAERFAGYARESAARVLAFLERPEARAGLVELRAIDPAAATDPEVARALLESELALLIAQFEHNWARLSDRLARFRGER